MFRYTHRECTRCALKLKFPGVVLQYSEFSHLIIPHLLLGSFASLARSALEPAGANHCVEIHHLLLVQAVLVSNSLIGVLIRD